MLGFTVYSSIAQAYTTGKIPYPCEGEKIEGGHAIVAVGYDNKMKIKNSDLRLRCNCLVDGHHNYDPEPG